MRKAYYQEQQLENIARQDIVAYDPKLYYGEIQAIPIESIIEACGLALEYQFLRKDGRILGETIFRDGLAAVYDRDAHSYTLIAVQAGTILIDASLCEDERKNGRLRFTCAHEFAHWRLHKSQYEENGGCAAMLSSTQDDANEFQADLLASILLMPMRQVKRCFYQLRCGRSSEQIVSDMASIFQVSKQAMRIRLQHHQLI